MPVAARQRPATHPDGVRTVSADAFGIRPGNDGPTRAAACARRPRLRQRHGRPRAIRPAPGETAAFLGARLPARTAAARPL
ncbi:hypothetical protein C6N75_11600 [Streptomyces solincola]|uniref:Uncharacterized protein n=1 Tax=Streptomyces solincola TaxID=2100817 RepID=A0A2S9PX95_9ACTN|nr:hypothetical protein C6N75_11600 [Streptomyces solincola]